MNSFAYNYSDSVGYSMSTPNTPPATPVLYNMQSASSV